MKNKKALYIALPVAVVAVIIVLLVTVFGPAGSRAAEAPKSSLGEYIPVDSDTVVITPSGKDWWKTLGSFTPVFFDLKNKQLPGDLNVSYYGYSRSPNHQKEILQGTGPLQLVYLESPNEEDAKKVSEWVRTNIAPDSKGMYVKTLGNVNVVSYNWGTLHLEKTDQPISKDPLFSTDVPLIWMNYDKMNQVLTTPGAPATKEASDNKVGPSPAPGSTAAAVAPGSASAEAPDLSGFLRSAVGITKGTVWKATSTDNGASWGGNFVAGGIDKSQIDPKKAQKIISDSTKVVFRKQGDGTSASVQELRTPGLAPLGSVFGLSYDGSSDSFGQGASKTDGLKSVPGQIVSGSSGIGTQQMDMSMPDSASVPSSIDGSQISASETQMNVKFADSGASDALYSKIGK